MVTLPDWEPRATGVVWLGLFSTFLCYQVRQERERECRELAHIRPVSPILMELCVWKIGIVESVTVRSLSHL